MEFRNILFPVDFSNRCRAAIPRVRAMARLFDASITLLHVVENPPAYAFDMPAISETHWQEMRLSANHALAAMVRADFEGYCATPAIRQGDAASEVEAYAEANGVDLIMMPTHGHGRFRAALLGSVAAKVLNDAGCAVWTSAHPEFVRPEAGAEFRNVLCAVDLGPESRSLIQAAAAFGASSGAKVRIVHATPPEENDLQRTMNLEFERFLKDCARTSIAALQKEAGTGFEVCMEAGKPARVVADVVRHHDADLVIVGHGKLHKFGGPIRSHAYSIIRESPCPVLSL